MTTMTATASGLRPVGAERVSLDEAAGEGQVQRLSRGQAAAVVLSVGLGVLVAGYGLAGSYLSISELADRHDVPLADPVAVGIHCAAPLMLLAMLEAGRGVLLRRIGEAQGARREPIPLIRWLLAPWRTLLL